MSEHAIKPIILGFAFGEVLADTDAVLIDVAVRETYADGTSKEGFRHTMVWSIDVLRQIKDGMPDLLKYMEENAATSSAIAPPKTPLPPLGAGTTLATLSTPLYICMGFSISDVVPELGACVATLDGTLATTPSPPVESADYLVGYQTLKEIDAAITHLLKRMTH